jgi:hypothetical protein
MSEYANDDNTITLNMQKDVVGAETDLYGNILSVDYENVGDEFQIQTAEPAPTVDPYKAPYVAKSKVQPSLDKKIVVFDMEATGVNPWDYRMLGGSFWELDKPITAMETFFGFDEEEVTRQCAEYLNRVKPDIMVCYNNGYDQRCLLTRFMLYQVPVPGWNAIEQTDMMEVLKKGTTQSIYSSQGAGSEETWLKYFFNESKPYDIEECFEGVRNLDLTRMTIRNRTCTEGVGYIYLLFRAVTDEEVLTENQQKPTMVNIDEAQEKGICLVTCPACAAVNDVPCSSKDNKCWRCLGGLPDPVGANVIKEVLRPYDFTKVGLK